MCTVCGCGATPHSHGHSHDHDHDHAHDHHHHHHHDHGDETARLVRVEQDILAHNGRLAAVNRGFLAGRRATALNLLSSPGSGKTTLLCATIAALKEGLPVAVIEGDQQTDLDAERIRAAGAPAHQVNTGKGCHLDAAMVARALADLDPPEGAVVFIENVGNLVCPAAFDLGEAARVVLLSVTEGDDKPLKYPDMFAAADLLLVTKADLAPHVGFDAARCLEMARRVNPDLEALTLSATTGEGMAAWLDWLRTRQARGPAAFALGA